MDFRAMLMKKKKPAKKSSRKKLNGLKNLWTERLRRELAMKFTLLPKSVSKERRQSGISEIRNVTKDPSFHLRMTKILSLLSSRILNLMTPDDTPASSENATISLAKELGIRECEMSDNGEWSCKIMEFGKEGEDEVKCNVEINEFQHNFTSDLKGKKVVEDETAVFEIGVEEDDAPVKWYKDGVEIIPDGK